MNKTLACPVSGSQIAIVLANIAQSRDCVLVIDQLDAVSLASGRNPQFFDCIFEIIKQAQAHPTIHLLLERRKFDLDNDNRLKRLIDEKNGVAKAIAKLIFADKSRTTYFQRYLEQIIQDPSINADRISDRNCGICEEFIATKSTNQVS
ncbi:MAG: hypothetical protein KME54_11980 [Tolypothrix brevis GSE-NOS-MK-07-07A]|nr:hypothetical protein [Tolypothrix brevis GSE-NOS-MK-07-07A]